MWKENQTMPALPKVFRTERQQSSLLLKGMSKGGGPTEEAGQLQNI